jgi:hypothetical protein
MVAQWMPTDNDRVLEMVSRVAPHAETFHHTRERSLLSNDGTADR